MAYLKKQIPLFILIFIFIFGCSKKANITKSDFQSSAFAHQVSSILLPIKLSNAILEKKMDTYLPNIIYQDTIMEDDNYIYTIKKVSKPSVQSAEKGFKISLIVHIDAKTNVDIGGFGGTFPLSADLKPTLLFLPKITKDWNLTFEVQWLEHEWIEKPFVKAGFFSMDVSGIADQVLNSQKDKMTAIVSEYLNNKIDIKPSINKIWNTLQEPFSLGTETPFWLHLNPDSMQTSTFKNSQGYLQMLLKLKANPIINEENKIINPIKKLASNLESEFEEANFNLFVDANIKHSFLDEFARKQITNQTFTISEGKKVKVNQVNFKNLKQKIAINLTLEGDYKGILTIYGTPFFDSNTTEIILKNPNFSVETENKLHKAATWLGKGKILKSMSPFLKISIKDHLDMLKSNIYKTLDKNKIYKNITLDGKLKNCTIDPIIGVSDSTYILHYILQGQAEAECVDIDF